MRLEFPSLFRFFFAVHRKQILHQKEANRNNPDEIEKVMEI